MTIRVAHISTSNRGGAAVAAQQIARVLQDGEIESTLISKDDLKMFQYGMIEGITRKLFGKIITMYQQLNTVSPFGIVTPISVSNLDVKKLMDSKFDIIHIHNWYNILSINDLAELSAQIPVVFTFHDERLITGGCHITLGCEKFGMGCTSCPAVYSNKFSIEKSKAELVNFFTNSPNISIISPSKWIIEQIKRAGLEQNLRTLSHIPNFISPEYFNSQVASIDSEEPIKLLFISADISTEVKGLSLLLNALNHFASEKTSKLNPRIELHLVGDGKLPIESNPNLKIVFHGFQTQIVIRELMTKATFLVVPSLSENSPNVIAEAQLLGLPVIASNVAGITELIEDSISGFLTPLDPVLMAAVFSRAFSSKFLSAISSQAKVTAQIRYDTKSISMAHIAVYRKALRGK